MKYAKCIWGEQVAKTAEEFFSRQSEERHVYCVGQTTKSKNGTAVLDCVPLNFIYDCLKYGRYIALLDCDDMEADYPNKGSYLGLVRNDSEQRVVAIMDSYDKATVDFVFQEVQNPELVHDGYIEDLPEDTQAYFNARKGL